MLKKIFRQFRKLPKPVQIVVSIIVLAYLVQLISEVGQRCMEQHRRAVENGDLGSVAAYRGDSSEDEEYDDSDYEDDFDYDDSSEDDDGNNSSYDDSDTGISYYSIGEPVYLKQGDGEFTLVITDWGSTVGALGDMNLYAQYEIENTGNADVKGGDILFDVYGDDYALETLLYDDGVHGDSVMISTVAPGRMLRGTLYSEMNPDDYSTIDIVIGDVDIRLKDE